MILTIILVAKYFYYLNTWVQNNILSRDFIILNLEIKTCSIPHIFLTKSIDLLVIGHFLSSPWLKWTLCPKVHCDKTIIPDKVAGLAVIVFLPRDALCVITNRYHNINREVPQRWNCNFTMMMGECGEHQRYIVLWVIMILHLILKLNWNINILICDRYKNTYIHLTLSKMDYDLDLVCTFNFDTYIFLLVTYIMGTLWSNLIAATVSIQCKSIYRICRII